MSRNLAIMLLIFILAAFFPASPWANTFLLQLGILVFIHIVFGQAWNLLGGFMGQISFGHAMFFGLGAYAVAIGVTRWSTNPYLALLAGGLLAVVMAIALGFLLFQLRGPYFSLGTLAFAEIIRLIATNWKNLTRGGEGILILNIPEVHLAGFNLSLGSKQSLYFLSLTCAVLMMSVAYWLYRSRYGYFMRAIKANEDAAMAIGLNTRSYKVFALAISAFFTALAGGIMAMVMGIVEPDHVFSVRFSVEMIFTAVIGGLGTVAGPAVGAVVLVVLTELLKEYVGTSYLMIYGLLLMLVILYLPGGIYGSISGLGKVTIQKQSSK